MKPGIYFSEEFGDLITYHKVTKDGFELGCHVGSPLIDFKFSDMVESALNQHYEYVCEFWDESAELERYKLAILKSKTIITEILVRAVSPLSLAIDKAESYLEEIDEILNGAK